VLVLWRVRAYPVTPDRERQAAVLREIERKRMLRGDRERPLDQRQLLLPPGDN
jgi:hypothetical protein